MANKLHRSMEKCKMEKCGHRMWDLRFIGSDKAQGTKQKKQLK